MLNKKFVVGSLFVAMLGLSACTKPEESSKDSADKSDKVAAFNPDTADGIYYADLVKELGAIPEYSKTVKLGGVAKSFTNEFWRNIKDGLETGASVFKDNGYDVSIDVKSAQQESDEQGQLAIVSDMINKKYTALLLSPISDSNLGPGVTKAEEKGIPTINVYDGLIAEANNFVGPKAIQQGELPAEWLAKKLDGKGEVAIIVGMPKVFAAKQRTAGFENYIKENAPGIDIVEKQNADWDRAKAKNIAETWIKTHPNLKAIFANNDVMALGVQEAVNSSGKDIIVMGVDGTSEAYESIKKGELDATVDSVQKLGGQIAVEMTMRKLAGQEIPRVVWTPQALIDSENVNKTVEEIVGWEGMQFK
ncbi:substrate-binding domain-containing protein [Pseudolactococcus yaeyamensis]